MPRWRDERGWNQQHLADRAGVASEKLSTKKVWRLLFALILARHLLWTILACCTHVRDILARAHVGFRAAMPIRMG
jgi:hypothetical protein